MESKVLTQHKLMNQLLYNQDGLPVALEIENPEAERSCLAYLTSVRVSEVDGKPCVILRGKV